MEKEQRQAAVKAKGTEALPPAGHEQREILKMREANLQEEAELLAQKIIMGAIPEDMLKIDRHIYQKIDMLEVSDKRDDMHYVWVNFKAENGHHVERKRILGYEVVSGTGDDCPEAKEVITEDGSRRIGDVLLMRIPRQAALAQMAEQRAQALTRRGILRNPDALAEMALKHTNGKIQVHTTLSEEHMRIAERRAQQRQMSRERAYARLGRQLEGGRVIHESHFAGRV